MNNHPTAIIGAGMAGLSAAAVLNAAGHRVQIFDKSRGSGGRMASKRTEFGALDLGVRFFCATDPGFAKVIEQWQALGWVSRWKADAYTVRDGACEPAARQERWVGLPRMSSLTRGLLGTLAATFGCRITEVIRGEHHWQLLDAEGNDHGPFDQVIVATPAPQAAALLAASPRLAAVAASVSMEPIWAVAAGFEPGLAFVGDCVEVSGGPLSWAMRNASKPGRDDKADTWVLHASHSWTKQHLDLPKEQVIEQLLSAFAEVIGTALPMPTFTLAHRWLYAQPGQAHSWQFLSSPETGLYACGDWCSSGSVEAAWLSGQAAARQILARQ